MIETRPAAAREETLRGLDPMGVTGTRGSHAEKRCNRHTRQRRIHRSISDVANPNESGARKSRK
jgi:hypothetical protein